MTRLNHILIALALGAVTLAAGACTSNAATAPTTSTTTDGGAIVSDSALFTLVTSRQPFSGYSRFPNLDTGPDGTLAASSAHQPLIRVSMNTTAAGALRNGKLPSGATFPDGSVIFKEVLTSGQSPNLYAIMYKDRTNTLAGNGWLWAEYRPDGGVGFSIINRGNGCTGCHALDQGPQNDFVRTFERQR
jgi:hypothetical protein